MAFVKFTAFLALGLSVYALKTPLPSNKTDPAYDTENCPGSVLPSGYGPVPVSDTPKAFLEYDEFTKAAAAAHAPPGFDKIFTDLKTSVKGQDYLASYELKEYSPYACAKHCEDMDGCKAFNVFFERSPKVEPNLKCKNPPSTTLIKCTLWSSSAKHSAAAAAATIEERRRRDFHIVIAGSNGYVRDDGKQYPGYKIEYFGHSSIGALVDCKGSYTYMGYKVYNATTYDAAHCAKACSEQNQYNIAHPPSDGSETQLCHFVNSYIENKNGVPQAQYCAMYSKAWHEEQATNHGQYHGRDHITISESVGLIDSTGNHDACTE